MRGFPVILAVSFLLAKIVAAQAMPSRAQVTGDRVSLRARPSLRAESVATVERGHELTVRGTEGDWIEVEPPPGISFYVHADFIADGLVDVVRLNVRAGPGINYSETGVLTRGDRVNVIGRFADWLEIKPPANTSLWINREYIDLRVRPATVDEPEETPSPPEPAPPRRQEPPPPPEPAPPRRPEPPPPPDPAPPRRPEPPPPPEPAPPRRPEPPPPRVTDEPRRPPVVVKPPPTPSPPELVQPPPALQRMGLVPLPGQGREAVYEGFLTEGGFLFIRPSRFRLIERGRGRVLTLCYVMGRQSQLEDLVGRELEIHGREYWLQGTRHPVLVAETIVTR